VPATRWKEAALALAGGGDHQLLSRFFPDFFLFLTIPFVFSVSSSGIRPLHRPRIQPCQMTPRSHTTTPPPSRDNKHDALRFKAEHDETRRELGEVSKKAGIAELEWEHQGKQLLETIDGKFLD
jgi:hypothetical protein